MSPAERAFLGAGIGLRRSHLDQPAAALPKVLELIPSHVLGRPELLDALAPAHTLVLHDVFASLGTAGPLDRAHLERVAALARRCGAVDYSEHLAMTRSPGGLDLGHLVALPRTFAQLDVLVEHVRAAKDILELPIAIELPTTTLELPGAELDEGEFVHALCERSACELHLDLENLRVDAENGLPRASSGARPGERAELLERALISEGLGPSRARVIAHRLAALPLHAVSRIHLAGGHRDASGWHVDSHSRAVPRDTWIILRALRSHVQPRTIIIERDVSLPTLAELADEAAHAEQIWTDRGSGVPPRRVESDMA